MSGPENSLSKQRLQFLQVNVHHVRRELEGVLDRRPSAMAYRSTIDTAFEFTHRATTADSFSMDSATLIALTTPSS